MTPIDPRFEPLLRFAKLPLWRRKRGRARSVRGLLGDSRGSSVCAVWSADHPGEIRMMEPRSPYAQPGRLTNEQYVAILTTTGKHPEPLAIPARCGSQPSDISDTTVRTPLYELGLLYAPLEHAAGPNRQAQLGYLSTSA